MLSSLAMHCYRKCKKPGPLPTLGENDFKVSSACTYLSLVWQIMLRNSSTWGAKGSQGEQRGAKGSQSSLFNFD